MLVTIFQVPYVSLTRRCAHVLITEHGGVDSIIGFVARRWRRVKMGLIVSKAGSGTHV